MDVSFVREEVFKTNNDESNGILKRMKLATHNDLH